MRLSYHLSSRKGDSLHCVELACGDCFLLQALLAHSPLIAGPLCRQGSLNRHNGKLVVDASLGIGLAEGGLPQQDACNDAEVVKDRYNRLQCDDDTGAWLKGEQHLEGLDKGGVPVLACTGGAVEAQLTCSSTLAAAAAT